MQYDYNICGSMIQYTKKMSCDYFKITNFKGLYSDTVYGLATSLF